MFPSLKVVYHTKVVTLAVGSDLGEAKCSRFKVDEHHCQAAFMGLHITASATAYLEV